MRSPLDAEAKSPGERGGEESTGDDAEDFENEPVAKRAARRIACIPVIRGVLVRATVLKRYRACRDNAREGA